MKDTANFRQLVNLAFDSDNKTNVKIPLEIPCHAYAMGIMCDYCIGDFLGTTVDSSTSDTEFLNILSDELCLMGLRLVDINYSDISNIVLKKRVIQITRMDTPCRDYHFYLFHPNGIFSQKFRHSEPLYSSKLELNYREYSLGIYSVERAL